MCDIVLLVYDQLAYTKGCVESILHNTGYPYRLLIIDNGSVNEETVVYLRELAAAHAGLVTVYRIERNIGYVGAVNIGLAKTTQDLVCVISNDTVVYPGWLSEMAAAVESDRKVGLVNPEWVIPKRFCGTRDRYFREVVRHQAGRYIQTDWARGFCFLVTREVISKIGGLDQAFAPAYFDDWDYSIRAVNAGFCCVRALGSFVWHYKNITYGLEACNEALRQKGKVFYGRWGAPLKLLLLHDRPQPACFAGYIDFVRRILSSQNRLMLTTARRFPVVSAHTNLVVRRICPVILHIYLLWQLFDNLRYVRARRYDMIICSSGIYNFLRSLWFINDAYAGRLYLMKDDDYGGLLRVMEDMKHKKAKVLTQ